MALDGEARDEPGRMQATRFEQGKDALRANEPELSARERRRRPHAARDETGLGVEIERETDDMAGQSGSPRKPVGSPPPCGEGAGVGVATLTHLCATSTTPLPNPPPQGGRE